MRKINEGKVFKRRRNSQRLLNSIFDGKIKNEETENQCESKEERKVKLLRAQGECPGTESRRRT